MIFQITELTFVRRNLTVGVGRDSRSNIIVLAVKVGVLTEERERREKVVEETIRKRN